MSSMREKRPLDLADIKTDRGNRAWIGYYQPSRQLVQAELLLNFERKLALGHLAWGLSRWDNNSGTF